MNNQQMKAIFALGLGAVLFSCASKPVPGSDKVKLIKADPDPKCKDLGSVSAYAMDPEDQKTLIRNEAAKKGANEEMLLNYYLFACFDYVILN